VDVRKKPVPPPQVLDVNVTIAGSRGSKGSRISLVYVRAPSGARVTVRCRGRGCKTRSQSVRGARRRLRFRKFERKLSAGAKLSVTVTKRGYIGRYISFKIRRRRAPLRSDLCLKEGATRPTRCPPS
jgi:hypothetical protein